MHHGVTAREEGFFARFGKRQNDGRLRHRQEPLELLARGVVGKRSLVLLARDDRVQRSAEPKKLARDQLIGTRGQVAHHGEAVRAGEAGECGSYERRDGWREVLVTRDADSHSCFLAASRQK